MNSIMPHNYFADKNFLKLITIIIAHYKTKSYPLNYTKIPKNLLMLDIV